MSRRIEFTEEAAAGLKRLDPHLQRRVLRKLEWIADNFASITPEPLSGTLSNFFKLRVGAYRVIYTTDDSKQVLFVHLVGHRSEIYQ